MTPEAKKELDEMSRADWAAYVDTPLAQRMPYDAFKAGFLARNRMLEGIVKNWPANDWLIYMRVLEMVNEIDRFREEK